MLNSGKKIALCATKKNNYSNSRVVGKNFLNETKNHNPSPLPVKWSVPNAMLKTSIKDKLVLHFSSACFEPIFATS